MYLVPDNIIEIMSSRIKMMAARFVYTCSSASLKHNTSVTSLDVDTR